MENNHFKTLKEVDVSKWVEKKDGLDYLSWSKAWEKVKEIYPDANYSIWRNPETFYPYVYDEELGYMVFTEMTIDGITHNMQLPVMDSKNKAMKAKAYTYKTKYGEKRVEPATMFDLNKTIMRCLVKNMAMFGLGLSLYQGEDLPSTSTPSKVVQKRTTTKISDNQVKKIQILIKETGMDKEKLYKKLNIKSCKDLSSKLANELIEKLEDKKEKQNG